MWKLMVNLPERDVYVEQDDSCDRFSQNRF